MIITGDIICAKDHTLAQLLSTPDDAIVVKRQVKFAIQERIAIQLQPSWQIWQRRSHNWSDHVYWTVRQKWRLDQPGWDVRHWVKV